MNTYKGRKLLLTNSKYKKKILQKNKIIKYNNKNQNLVSKKINFDFLNLIFENKIKNIKNPKN